MDPQNSIIKGPHCTDIVMQWNNKVMLWLPIFFYHDILQRNYRKMTISYNSFVKLPLYSMIHLQSIPMDPKDRVIKELHCSD